MTDAANPMEDLAQAWARAMTGFLTPPGQGADVAAGPTQPSDVMGQVTDAHLAATNSYFRYMKDMADVSGRAYMRAVRATTLWGSQPGSEADELGTALDELRESLREMSELPMNESRRLQSELAELRREGAAEPDTGSEAEPKRRQRRARAKP